MATVFYTVKIVYICVFVTCSTSYCLCDTRKDPWKVCMCVCMYVCIMYVCMYYVVYMYYVCVTYYVPSA